MNPLDHRLDRLLDAAQKACPSVPAPSPWFEQHVIQSLQMEENQVADYRENILIFRIFSFAVIVMAVSVTLPLLQPANPYLDALDVLNSTPQIIQTR